MMLHIKKSNLLKIPVLFIYSIFALILCNWLINHEELTVSEWAKLCSNTAICLFLVQFIIMRTLKVKILSLEFIFMSLVYVFYLGQSFLVSIAYDFGKLIFSLSYITYGAEYYINSTKYSFSCIAFVFLGLMLGSDSRIIHSDDRSITNSFVGLGLNKSTAKVMFIISVPFELYSCLYKIYTVTTSTYLDAHASGGGILVEFMSAIFFASIMFFLMDSADDEIKCRKIFTAIVIYELITMITGQRAMGAMKIFLSVFVYYSDGRKINWKTALKLFFGIIIASYILVVIRNSRADGLTFKSLNFMTNGFLLFDVISEFGITGKVVTAAMVKTTEFAQGKSLFCSFLAVVPGWSNLFGDNLIDKYYTFVALDQQSWGSSFISDLYFDFGFYGGIAASGIYAVIVGRFFYKFKEYLINKMYGKASCYAYFVLQFIYTVRSYIFRLPRYFMYFLIIYWLCVGVVKLLWLSKYHRVAQNN